MPFFRGATALIERRYSFSMATVGVIAVVAVCDRRFIESPMFQTVCSRAMNLGGLEFASI